MNVVIAGLLAAALAWLVVGPGGTARLVEPGEVRRTLPRWVVGRPDALSLRLRLVMGLCLGVGVWLVFGLPLWVLPVLVVGVGSAVVIGVGLLEPASARRRSQLLVADLPHACQLLAACLDAGLPLRAATRTVGEAIGGPVGAEFARVTRQIDLGVTDEEAWLALTDPALRRMSRDLARAAGAGLVASGPLRTLAADAALRAEAQRQEVAKRVGVSSVLPLMVCFLPAFMLLGIVPIVGGYVLALLGG